MPSLPLPGDTPNTSSSIFLPLLTEHENRCGSCAACCTDLSIAELNKPQGTPCQHLCESGCSIYRDRPDVCQDYSCLWHLLNEEGKYRPDNINLLCEINEFSTRHFPRIQVVELSKGAASTTEGREWISRLQNMPLQTSDGNEYWLPVCVIRFVEGITIERRPLTWYVNELCLCREAVLETLRRNAADQNRQYRCGRNQPCPCGSGLKYKRCHARFVEIVTL